MSENIPVYGTPETDFEMQWRRLLEAAGCASEAGLAKLLNTKSTAVSRVRRDKAIPPEWLLGLLRLRGTNPDWILTGLGPELLGPASGPASAITRGAEIRPPARCSAQELVNELVRRALADM